MKIFFLSLFTLLFVTACGSEDEDTELSPQIQAETPQEQFYANLASLCGETFEGESTFPDDPDHDLVNTVLKATVKTCTDERIEVDFIRDGNTWHATWILEMREDGLHLYHDHIGEKEYPEGEEPLTGYGGYADDRGTEFMQYFPADDYTAEILPEAATNVWMMEYDPQAETFVYALERHEQPRFRAQLSKQQ
ncbi:hypothetical protein [Rhodohalobacter halophilus]|uniref:hypothetical protein n=1 Tax=Rhodohalobacter halophilus TaxID=1812810 RepID=UPI00114CE9ED|nr:hypothetical protein [Rhodohalobacter halophilus]